MMKQKFISPLDKDSVLEVFQTSYLYELESFNFIDKKTLCYDTNRRSSSFIEESQFIHSKFKSGHTIIVKNMEFYNDQIIKVCNSLGNDVNVHLYLVPHNGGDSFDFHIDDRDVLIYMIYGTKSFYLKKSNEIINKTVLKKGDQLIIPKNTSHKAEASGSSCLLSFGIKRFENYKIPTPFLKEDLD